MYKDEVSYNHFTVAEMKEISAHINKIKEIIGPRIIKIKAEERDALKQNYKSKRQFVSKVFDYRLCNNELSSKEIDWDSFNLIFADKVFLKSSMLCLKNILLKMDDIHLVYNNENYKSALLDYEQTRDKVEEKKTKYKAKYDELKLLFSEIK